MHEMVQEYLNNTNAKRLKDRNDILIEEGLFTKAYGPESMQYASDTFPFFEQTPDGRLRFYQKIAVPVTDEEFEQILQAKKELKNKPDNSQKRVETVAIVLYIIAAILFVIGFFAGISSGTDAGKSSSDFNWGLAAIVWGSSFVSGMFFVALGKIIDLLSSINSKT